jgi:hypothetical protein
LGFGRTDDLNEEEEEEASDGKRKEKRSDRGFRAGGEASRRGARAPVDLAIAKKLSPPRRTCYLKSIAPS